jgi:hypothetical protein
MNIFKIIASSKKSFPEEYCSTFLAWLLNPVMEHGLGSNFLEEFLKQLEISSPTKFFKFRNTFGEEEQTFNVFLELDVVSKNYKKASFVDIVVEIDDDVIAVENKIKKESVSDKIQLQREYEGLKEKFPKKNITMIYLVPSVGEVISTKIENFFNNNLTLKNKNDSKVIFTWQCSQNPSIEKMISTILNEEAVGNISPVSEYTKHTLKAFKQFIVSDFAPYEFDKKPRSVGLNPLTEKRLTLQEIKSLTNGFIGVASVAWLFKKGNKRLKTHKYQFTNHDMSSRTAKWMDVSTFKKMINWLVEGKKIIHKWNGTYPYYVLYKITKDFDGVYIGVMGGEEELVKMDNSIIENKKWAIESTSKPKSKNWIDGKTFHSILRNKKVRFPWQ